MVTALRQSKSALHVEDDEKWQKMLHRYLQEAGYDVIQTGNLQDAKARACRKKFDLYVVDGHFPLQQDELTSSESGKEFYNFIVQIYEKDVNYVFVSGGIVLKKWCNERGIRFFNKDVFSYGSFMAYLKSKQ